MATVLPRVQRGPGVIDSGTVDVSGQTQANTNYILTALLTNADRDDPTISIPVQLWIDGVLVRDETWNLGQTDRNGNPVAPTLAYSTGAAGVQSVRGVVNLPKRMSFGVDLTLGTIAALVAG